MEEAVCQTECGHITEVIKNKRGKMKQSEKLL